MRWSSRAIAVTGLAAGVYLGLVTGAVPVDLNVGRRRRVLGPRTIRIEAPRDVVYAMIRAPYGERVPRALQEKVRVLERGTDLVLAAHYTPLYGPLRATTVETVRFRPPERVDFRLVRGPVPSVTESFVLTESELGTELTYEGELGTDLWGLGERWGAAVANRWEAAVDASLAAIKREAEHHRGAR